MTTFDFGGHLYNYLDPLAHYYTAANSPVDTSIASLNDLHISPMPITTSGAALEYHYLHDIMSYGPLLWVSDYTYKAWIKSIYTRFTQADPGGSANTQVVTPAPLREIEVDAWP